MDETVAMVDENETVELTAEQMEYLANEPKILEAVYRPEPGLEFLMLRLSDGRRLLIPKEELSELKNATPEQAADVVVLSQDVAVWWPQLDDGLYLPDFLERRWGNVGERYGVAA